MATTQSNPGRHHEVHRMPELRAGLQTDPRISDGLAKRSFRPPHSRWWKSDGDRFVRQMCMHCQDPACASACLVGALKKTPAGPVTYDGVEVHRLPLLSGGVPVQRAAL